MSTAELAGQTAEPAVAAVAVQDLQVAIESTGTPVISEISFEIAPGETLTTPAGLRLQELLPYGRDATSIAFFSTPGTPRLYSGVTNSTASNDSIFCLKSRTTCGGSDS